MDNELLNNTQDTVPNKNEPINIAEEAFEWIESLVKALAILIVLNVFVFRIVTVDGPSMLPTLKDQDKLVITNLLYTPSRGDIVVLQADKFENTHTGKMGEPIIKRVVGIAGDKIEIDFENGEVRRNGELLNEDFIADLTHNSLDMSEAVVVPENQVFVLGDNRNNSRDSRDADLGCVDVDLILGKAQLRLFPMDRFGALS